MSKAKDERQHRLMPGGIPRWIRVYDNGGRSVDRFTVVYTGRYAEKAVGWCQYVGMSERPYHPQGFGQHGEADHMIDTNKWGFAPAMGRKCHLGKRIPFAELPPDCQRLVLQDYCELWSLTMPADAPKPSVSVLT